MEGDESWCCCQSEPLRSPSLRTLPPGDPLCAARGPRGSGWWGRGWKKGRFRGRRTRQQYMGKANTNQKSISLQARR